MIYFFSSISIVSKHLNRNTLYINKINAKRLGSIPSGLLSAANKEINKQIKTVSVRGVKSKYSEVCQTFVLRQERIPGE